MTERDMLKVICNHECNDCPLMGTGVNCFWPLFFNDDISKTDKVIIADIYNRHMSIDMTEKDIIDLLFQE